MQFHACFYPSVFFVNDSRKRQTPPQKETLFIRVQTTLAKLGSAINLKVFFSIACKAENIMLLSLMRKKSRTFSSAGRATDS